MDHRGLEHRKSPNGIMSQDWHGYFNGNDKIIVTEYVKTSRRLFDQVRRNLKQNESLPKVEFQSVEQLFLSANQAINAVWAPIASNLISDQIKAALNQSKKTNSHRALSALVNDKNKFQRTLEKNNFFKFEEISSVSMDVWREILLFASIKEQLKLELISQWLELPNISFQSLGISRQELTFAVDLQKSVQPLIDIAFIKQLNHDENDVPPEIGKISENIKIFSKIISRSHHLKSCAALPNHLNKIAEALLSKEKDPKKSEEVWNQIDSNTNHLVKLNCPILINCHSKSSGHGDELEFSVQLQTKETANLTKIANEERKEAQRFTPNKSIPKVVAALNISNSGVDLYYQTMGEARKKITSIYTDRLERSSDGKVKRESFFTTLYHELGHELKRINNDGGIFDEFDEFKADLLGIFLFKNRVSQGIFPIPIRDYIKQLVYGYSDEILIPTDSYSRLGKFFLLFFAKNGITHVKANQLIINENNSKFFELAKIGDRLLYLCEDRALGHQAAKDFLTEIAHYESGDEEILKKYIRLF